MALDLEEQEKLEELKAWWRQHGTLVAAVILAVAAGFASWQGWRWYQANQAANASALYDQLTKAVQANDPKALRDAAGTLVETYPRTAYAAMGALVTARYFFEREDLRSAKLQLQWVMERARSEDFRDLARLRLAALLLDEKAYDEALKLLQQPHGAAYEAPYAALRGDILVAQDQTVEARTAYTAALEKAARQDPAFQESIRMRLEALGG
ncbi:MAG TPA: tetratricopeptide repeat protein [Burkholderiales bacterium]|nr:tetratricopeptide repeat protein [Burkholderiales bacterium]